MFKLKLPKINLSRFEKVNRIVNESTLNTSNYIFLLDNGHGGVIDGVYQTAGKRSPEFEDGRVLYEGEFNRDIVNRISKGLVELNIRHVKIAPELEDVSLRTRVKRANEIQSKQGNTIFISVHANAFKDYWNDANGVEVFYYQDGNKFSKLGNKLAKLMQSFLVEKSQLRDRGHKGANFYVLRKTSMPSILTECGFMTNKNEAELLLDNNFRQKIAQAHIDFIASVDRNKLI